MKDAKPPRLIQFPALRERGVLLSRRQVERLEAKGKFPRRVQISEGRVGWVTAEIDEWIEARIAARSKASE